jgi:predicted RNase H-like HicB family nuclease
VEKSIRVAEKDALLNCSPGDDFMSFKVVLEPSQEGGYTVYVPSLPGCISEGDTVEQALKNIQEAIELYPEPVED